MVDQEVEDILKQIRNSVRAEEERNARPVQTQNGNPTGSNSTAQPPAVQSVQNYPNLSTLNRAWDRLPPVMSNRRGALASAELWLKQILKRGSRWFTWEQINFNNAVHHTFREVIDSLTTFEQQLGETNNRLLELQQHQRRFEEFESELRQLSKTTSELARLLLTRDRELHALQTKLAALEVAWDRWEHQRQDESKEVTARVNESLLEIRSATERVLDEQRVCFKQMHLEVAETSAREERDRRALNQRIAKLEGAHESSSKASGGSES